MSDIKSNEIPETSNQNQVSETTQLVTEPTNLMDIKLDEKQKNVIDIGKILMSILADGTKLDELSMKLKLTKENISFMQDICNLSPELLSDIDDAIVSIVSDNVIDSKDVPQLVVLIKNVYKKFTDSKKLKNIKNITLEDSILFIKNLILILIEYDHIKVKDRDSVVLIIDLCIDLLTTSIDMKINLLDKIKSCFTC